MPKTTITKTIELTVGEIQQAILSYLDLSHLPLDTVQFDVKDVGDEFPSYDLEGASVEFEE